MATFTRTGVSLATTLHDPAPHGIKGRAAVDLTAGDMVYMNTSGQLALANGTSANSLALAVGMVTKDSKSGEKAVAFSGVEVNYSSAGALTPLGGRVYVSATAGAIDDATTTGGTVPVGIITSAYTIYILPPTR